MLQLFIISFQINMISGQLFGILLLNLIGDGTGDGIGDGLGTDSLIEIRGLGDIEGTTVFPMEDSTGPPKESSDPPMEDYEDSIPFQCNHRNQPGGSDKPSSKAQSKSVINLLLRYEHCSKYYKLT